MTGVPHVHRCTQRSQAAFADALFRLVQNGFDNIPDQRLTDTEISLTDALMSAFAMFSLTSPSLLAFDKERAAGNQDHPHLKFMITEDSLSSNAPHIETLHAHGLHYILGVKAGDHAYLFQQVQAAEHSGRVTSYERHDRAAGLVHRFRFVNDVPLNQSNAAIRVNVIEYWEMNDDRVQHFSWVTDLRVSRRNVYALMRGGRARWKIENETLNTLKNQGYHFERNYGHGMQNLSVVFAMVLMLAFLVDQTQQLCCALFQAVWAKLGRSACGGSACERCLKPCFTVSRSRAPS